MNTISVCAMDFIFPYTKIGFFLTENAENVMCEQACENSMRTLKYLDRRCLIVREHV